MSSIQGKLVKNLVTDITANIVDINSLRRRRKEQRVEAELDYALAA